MAPMNSESEAGVAAGGASGATWSFRLQAIVVFVVAILAHASSLGNRYALDDTIIILRNVDVQRGFAGIGNLLTQDAYQGFYETMGVPAQLAGGRYRPLSSVTFAIEQSLFGETHGDEYRALRAELESLGPGHARAFEMRESLRELLDITIPAANLAIATHRHVIQLLLFGVSMVALLAFLRRAIPSSAAVAFVSTLVFALHPIHVEVVANVKSRDEILSLLFIALAGIALFRHDRTRMPRDMAQASVLLFLALLSKEYAVIAPVVLGAALVLARGRRPVEVIRAWAPLLVVVSGYLAMRFLILGETPRPDLATQDVLNDPFLPLRLGTAAGSVLATKLSILPHYLRLLAVPHPLSSDYSYATFPFVTFGSPSVWLALALYGAIVAATLLAWRRRHPLALAGIAYLAFLLPVSNLPFEIGATMGERLAYHASLGFALLLGWLLVEVPGRIVRDPKARTVVIATLVVAAAVPYVFASLRRDAQWRDDRTLFLTDVKTVPHSALANGNAGAQLMNEGLEVVQAARRAKREPGAEEKLFAQSKADQSLVYLRRAVEIHPRYANSWVNIGLCLFYKDEWDEAAEAFAKGGAIYTHHPLLQQYGTNFHSLGTNEARDGRLDDAVTMFRRAVATWPQEILFWRDYAGASFMTMRFGESRRAFDKVLEMVPGDADATGGKVAAAGLEQLEQTVKEHPDDPAALRKFAAALKANSAPSFVERAKMLELTASLMEKAK
ncbi:MAG: tetratricopeptide repeat protein [Thermoanaerobaculia bacterium]|jgi:hypothetical protein